jgi:hypothetical protein
MVDNRLDARATLEAYLKAWQEQNWTMMTLLMQLTGREYGWDNRKMRDAYSDYRLYGFEIKSSNHVSLVCVDFVVNMGYVYGPASTEQQVMQFVLVTARVVKENAPFGPDARGTWGVNPHSLLRLGSGRERGIGNA